MVDLKSWKDIPCLKGPGWKTIQFHGRIYPPALNRAKHYKIDVSAGEENSSVIRRKCSSSYESEELSAYQYMIYMNERDSLD